MIRTCKDDRHFLYLLQAVVLLAFGALFLLLWWAHWGELKETQIARELGDTITKSNQTVLLSQRLALLQYGALSRRSSPLQWKLRREIDRTVTMLKAETDALMSIQDRGVLSSESLEQTARLVEIGRTLCVQAVELSAAIDREDTTRDLVSAFAQTAEDMVRIGRRQQDLLGADALAHARTVEEDRNRLFVFTMSLTCITALFVLAIITLVVGRELSNRRVAEQALHEANRELEEFSSIVAHDLNGPLGNLSLAAQMLEQKTAKGESRVAELTSSIVAEARRLHEMVTALLKLSRVASTEIEPVEVNLRELVRNVERSLGRQLAAAKAVVTVKDEARLLGDPRLLENVFQNLVENSIKYARPGVFPEITIAARQEDQLLEVSYDDNGLGIPPEGRTRVFEPFYQCMTRPQAGGIGLGLSVVKKIVLAHGGAIRIEDKETPGTRFAFLLPGSLTLAAGVEPRSGEEPPLVAA